MNFADSFVVAESFMLRINICAETPAHRKSANRCTEGERSEPSVQRAAAWQNDQKKSLASLQFF
ncbi:MAG: hypothetical protein ACOYPR_09365 [Saprospiraceae bacterium]